MRYILILCLFSYSGFSQSFDTIVSHTNYEKLNFHLDNGNQTTFEVTTTEVKTENGIVLSTSVEKDTFLINKIKEAQLHDTYSLTLSKSNWSKLLFGKQCRHLINAINKFPELFIKRNKTNNKIEFVTCDSISSFLLEHYTNRLECINSSDDQFMAKYVNEWINDIDSCNLFINSFTSYSYHLFSLYDLLIPFNTDSLQYSIGVTDTLNNQHFQTLLVTKSADYNGNKRISFTDEIPGSSSIQDQLTNSLYGIFSEFEADSLRVKNEIRMNSIKSTDRSEIEISQNQLLNSYLRIRQSQMLNSELKPRVSYYNFKIERIN